MKRILIVAFAAVAVGAGAYYWARKTAPERDTLRVSGNIEATDRQLGFQVPGRVAERLVSEGDRVQAGQVVARLDTIEMAREVAVLKAGVKVAEATLSELEAGSRSEEIAQARAAVAAAQAEVDRWRAEAERQKDLFEKDIISSREAEVAIASDATARARLQEAQQRFALVQRGPRKEQIDQARARLEQAKESMALAETRLAYATLTSPVTGVVLSDSIEAGEQVAAGTPVVTVADLTEVWMRAYVDETDLGRVKLSQPVRVRTDTYPGKTYTGRLTFIAQDAEFTPKSVQTEKERVRLVYRIKIDIPNPDQELKPGMPADGEIQLVSK